MGYRSLDISLYKAISSKVRSQIDQANRDDKYGHGKWPEKLNLRNSKKCLTQNNGRSSTNQHLYYRFNQRRAPHRIKLVLQV